MKSTVAVLNYTGSRLERANGKKTVSCGRVPVTTELFNIAVNDIDEKEPIIGGRPLLTGLVVCALLHRASESVYFIDAVMTFAT